MGMNLLKFTVDSNVVSHRALNTAITLLIGKENTFQFQIMVMLLLVLKNYMVQLKILLQDGWK